MTYDEFLRDPDVPAWAEWVDGEVIELSPVTDWHQNLADFLAALFRHYGEASHLGEVRSAPFQMKLARSGREPDVLFVAREHTDRLRETHLEGPADLAIEVISPDSRTRDRSTNSGSTRRAAYGSTGSSTASAGRPRSTFSGPTASTSSSQPKTASCVASSLPASG
jgi:hypothetical protein